MKIWNKFTAALLIFTVLTTLLSLSAFAASDTSEEPETSNTLSIDDLTFVFKYTSDSVVTEGVTVQSYSDPVSNTYGVELVPDFGIGYAIYDNPDTEIIDGIRINGAETSTLRIPLSSNTAVTSYEIAIRTVYVDSAAGDLAQILDGVYDYSKLLTNPIVLLQTVYWLAMAITGLVGIIALIKNKGKRIKTADDIAKTLSERNEEFKAQLLDIITKTVKEEILPLAQASVKSGKEAVKAIVLSTSNAKDAPLALLDVFKDSEDIDIDTVVENVRESLLKAMQEHSVKRSEDIDTLHSIANHNIQEVVEDAKKETGPAEPETFKSHKSVF